MKMNEIEFNKLTIACSNCSNEFTCYKLNHDLFKINPMIEARQVIAIQCSCCSAIICSTCLGPAKLSKDRQELEFLKSNPMSEEKKNFFLSCKCEHTLPSHFYVRDNTSERTLIGQPPLWKKILGSIVLSAVISVLISVILPFSLNLITRPSPLAGHGSSGAYITTPSKEVLRKLSAKILDTVDSNPAVIVIIISGLFFLIFWLVDTVTGHPPLCDCLECKKIIKRKSLKKTVG